MTQPSLQRKILIELIAAHPGLTLADLADFGPKVLAQVRVGDLFELSPSVSEGLAARGESFDRLVLEVVRSAPMATVRAAQVRSRLGGPRWKLQASFRRLVAAGLLDRQGVTGNTRYRLREGERN